MKAAVALALAAVLTAVVPGSASAESSRLAEHPRMAESVLLLVLWADAQRAYERIPGVSIAVVHDQELLFEGGFGYAHLSSRSPATPSTLYSICSISKLFTAISVLQLRDRGLLQLDDPLSEHLPWLDIQQGHDGAPPITLRGILTHSAGLPRESAHPYWTFPDYAFPTREEVRERLSSQKTLYPEGRYFQYSNLGLTLAGEVVAEVSGEPYAEYARRNILDPLGMTDTTPEIPVEHRGGRLATGYGGLGREGGREPLELFQTRGIAAAAGYASTVRDLARFASWQLRLLASGGEEILKASTLREMQRVHYVDPGWETTWGLGFSVRRRDDETFVGHGGSCPGFRSDFLLHPRDRLAAIAMANAADVNAGAFTRQAYEILAPAVEEALGSESIPEPTDEALTRYTGAYRTGWGGEIAILPWKGALAMVPLPSDEPREALEELRKTEEHVFRRVLPDGELGEEIVFTVEDGKATRFTRHSNHYPRLP